MRHLKIVLASALVFARGNGLRVAVKGTGHDYLGRSGAPGALLIWTHRMRQTTVHESFRPAGSPPDRYRTGPGESLMDQYGEGIHVRGPVRHGSPGALA